METKYIFNIVDGKIKAEEDDPKYILLCKHDNTYKIFGTYNLLRQITNEVNDILDKAKEKLRKNIMKP